jgi:hypothetical protein
MGNMKGGLVSRYFKDFRSIVELSYDANMEVLYGSWSREEGTATKGIMV